MDTTQNSLKFCYEMTVSCARPGTPLSDEDRQILERAIAEYNEKSSYMANPKQIHLLEVTDYYINIRLFSTQVLTTPGRGLRALTTILLSEPASRFANRVTPGGQLFRVISVKQPEIESASMDPALISDVNFLKAMIDYIMTRKDGSAAKKAAVEEMKKLAVEAGIIAS